MTPRAPKGSWDTSGRRPHEASSEGGRQAPALHIEIPLEGKARVRIAAESYEDALRLRQWLRAALVRRGHILASDLITLCDELDRREAA